jgi:hypothetical protein
VCPAPARSAGRGDRAGPRRGDTNPDWLASTALTSTFVRCRRGDLNPHGIAPTSTSSWFRLLSDVHRFAFAQLSPYLRCLGLTPRDTLCRVAIARYCTPDPAIGSVHAVNASGVGVTAGSHGCRSPARQRASLRA